MGILYSIVQGAYSLVSILWRGRSNATESTALLPGPDSKTENKVKPIRKLTQAEEKEVEAIFEADEDDVVADRFNIEIKVKDIVCLQPETWLNDEVINFYLSMLDERCKRNFQSDILRPEQKLKCHFFNSFFYTKLTQSASGYNYQSVQNWSKRAKVDIVSMDKVIIPIHVDDSHWSLCVINFRDKRFEFYDSLGGSNPECLQHMRRYVQDEAKNYQKLTYDFSDWQNYVPRDIPHQTNGCDCGVFALKYADYISEDRPLDFSQKQMEHFRKMMVLEIKSQKVL